MRNGRAFGAMFAALVVGIGAIGVVSSSGSSTPALAAAALVTTGTPAFEAKFDTPGDFYSRFDYGLSGQSPAGRDNPNVAGAGGVFPAHGDHDMNCSGPDQLRDVTIHGETWDNGDHFPDITFDELFWWCAPGNDPAKGHVMTGFTTTGYNHLWFSPQQEFSRITAVCWDQNANTIGGKWLEVQFVDHADAVRYPTGSHPADSVVARGTGGFDLGYTEPDFRPEATGGNSSVGPNNGLQPRSGNLAGLKSGVNGSIFDWWQDQDIRPVGSTGVGWPGLLSDQGGNPSTANSPPLRDKATRYEHCLENVSAPTSTSPGTMRISFVTPEFPSRGWHAGGVQSYTIPGQIPQDSRRVVFHDAEYDGPKRGDYSPTAITWHWDNIRIYTAGTTPPPPTSTTSTPASTTTSTSSTTTTTRPTTTSSTTTTVKPTTTTGPTTTTTRLPALVCPTGFTAAQRAWCQNVNARITALEARAAS